MAQLFIHLAFSRIQSHEQLVASFIDLNKIKQGEHLQIQIDFDSPTVYCDYLLLIVAYVKSLRDAGIELQLDFPGLVPSAAAVQHAVQIGFFRQLEIELPSPMPTQHCTCLCSEIVQFQDPSEAAVATSEIVASISNNSSMQPGVADLVHACLQDIMTNAIDQGKSNTGAFAISQYFPFRGELRLMVCHAGTLDLVNCTDNELSRTAACIKANKGFLTICSGSEAVELKDGKSAFSSNSGNWQGTYVFLRIKTDHLSDYQSTLKTEPILEVQDFSISTSVKKPTRSKTEVLLAA